VQTFGDPLLGGGGLFGALIIFIVAKMFGK